MVIVGQKHLNKLRGPLVLVANHSSHLDAPLVLLAMPRRLRRSLAVAAAKDYFFASAYRAVPAQILLGAFPLARTGPILPSLEQCGRLVDRGWSILIFPEGTRSVDGSVGQFKAGIGLLARELRVPVVPIGIHGARERLPKGRTIPVPGSVRLSIGAPVLKDRDETDQTFADRLREQVIALLA
jgi:1-acyl-sn-glycerol-3-phosphate acyltransferase